MLKKSDLAKQFELVVQQEIKNYQDSLNFVLQSINELKEEIRLVRSESLENYGLIHSQYSDLAIQLQNLTDSHKSLNQSYINSCSEQIKINERNNSTSIELTSGIDRSLSFNNKFQNDLIKVKTEMMKMKSECESQNRVINDNLDDLLRRFRNEILKTKQEILETPSEASLIKTQLEEKIYSHKVDVEGIMRELRVYKHDNMITEKKIEHIYTLIDRLKKSGGES